MELNKCHSKLQKCRDELNAKKSVLKQTSCALLAEYDKTGELETHITAGMKSVSMYLVCSISEFYIVILRLVTLMRSKG